MSSLGTQADLPPILRHLPPAPDPDALLDGFVDYVAEQGISLYDAQEEAILEILAGNNVILNTPTGSGKSMVALAAHFVGLAANQRSVYTAPIKALVSEKFFALCKDFGSERVGMITGDGSINPGAPIICCTAEILANWALRDGPDTDVDLVIVDEFHYYADPQRGWAWQVPLLELPHCQFLLLSATLGPTEFFQRDLEQRTGRSTILVRSEDRPVPLEFEYRRTGLHRSIETLLETNRAPIYLVHFTQREATEAAQGYLSLDPLSKTEKERVKAIITNFRFDSPIGKDLRRFVAGGIGVHHAGLLPKYRLLMEKLAQEGLLKIICGTDTLGVGVNVPIRTVLFTQLCKYDGNGTRLLSKREFKQIAGRAGRKGFDDTGTVWAQAPAHVVENLQADEKAANDPKKKKKTVKKKQPERGYAHWTEETFTKLIDGDPEPLRSSFTINHQMIMSLLDRPGDGCAAVTDLLTDNHEPRKRQRHHIRRAISIYRSLVAADLLEFPPVPDELGRKVRVNFDLQDDFALHQPLSLWALEAIGELSRSTTADDTELDGDTHALAALTIIESILENPAVIIASQLSKAKDELMAEMKSSGVEYDERMARLADVEPPRPHKQWLYESFDRFRVKHPWVGSDNVRPKSVVRDLYERGMTFTEHINFYGLKRSEGVVLRYFTDVYKALVQNIPEEAKTDEIIDLTEWLGAVVRQVDSSLIDEWERLTNPDFEPTAEIRPGDGADQDITRNERAFRVMARNEAFRILQLLARRRTVQLAEEFGDETAESLGAALVDYFEEYPTLLTDADARSPQRFVLAGSRSTTLTLTQTLHDPDDNDEWVLRATVDIDQSREQGKAVLTGLRLERL